MSRLTHAMLVWPVLVLLLALSVNALFLSNNSTATHLHGKSSLILQTKYPHVLSNRIPGRNLEKRADEDERRLRDREACLYPSVEEIQAFEKLYKSEDGSILTKPWRGLVVFGLPHMWDLLMNCYEKKLQFMVESLGKSPALPFRWLDEDWPDYPDGSKTWKHIPLCFNYVTHQSTQEFLEGMQLSEDPVKEVNSKRFRDSLRAAESDWRDRWVFCLPGPASMIRTDATMSIALKYGYRKVTAAGAKWQVDWEEDLLSDDRDQYLQLSWPNPAYAETLSHFFKCKLS